jgi:hypothetical protein
MEIMRRVKLLVVATLLAIPTTAISAGPAHACYGEICDAVNLVCAAVKKDPCVK